MAALDRHTQIMERPRAKRDRMNRNAQTIAEHPARIGNTARLVDDVGGRRRLDGFVAVFATAMFRVAEQSTQMNVVDQDTIERAFSPRVQASRLAALYRENHILDAMIRQLLGGIDGFSDRAIGQLEARYGARAHALRFVHRGAEHLDSA